jgi:hyperosmotically inducible periplasmic protein
MDYSMGDAHADIDREESLKSTTTVTQPPRVPRWPLALGALAIVLAIGMASLISTQGWATTESQAYGVARAIKDTTVAVGHNSADAATTAKAKAALALSKRVSAWQVDVDTTNAVATLTGTVPTQEAKDVAEQIVADTSGVRDVRNQLMVDLSMRPEQERDRLARRVADLETQTALGETLQDCPELVGAKVHVRVADGMVILDGTVLTDAQRARADELARTFPGVQQLRDRLK